MSSSSSSRSRALPSSSSSTSSSASSSPPGAPSVGDDATVAWQRRAYLARFGGRDPVLDDAFFSLQDLRGALRTIRDENTQVGTPLDHAINGVEFTAGEYAYLYMLYSLMKRKRDKRRVRGDGPGGGAVEA